MKTAILGGSFDPFHHGHLAMAKAALAQEDIEEVWLMPAGDTPLKDRKLAAAADRLAMMELAADGEERIRVCTLELEREGKSYTIDTLRELKQLYPEKEFVWLIGADQLVQLDQWKDADQLQQLAEFACFARTGSAPEGKEDIRWIEMEPVDVSSTQIRHFENLEQVDPAVLRYIYDHELYLYDFMQSVMPEKRYHHSLMVAALCRAMAVSNHADGKKAYLAGLLHDITKYMPKEKQKMWMERCAAEHLNDPIAIWHGFTGAYYAGEIMKVEDPDILSAIYHHVLGDGTSVYDKILFCADKLDPLRDYNSSQMLAACMQEIGKGFEIVYRENQKYLKEKKK